MKKLIYRISLIVGICVLSIGSLFVISDNLLTKREPYLFKMRDNITIVFAGDSNIECAINDSLIANSINIAESGEAYLYTYKKIRSLLVCNNQIRTIFLGYAYHDIEKETEDRWLFKDEFVVEKIKTYDYLLNNSERMLLFNANPKSYLRGMRDCTVQNIIEVFNSYFFPDKFRYGGYLFLSNESIPNIVKRQDTLIPHYFEKGNYQLVYLKKISDLCREKSVKLILINTPKHRIYTSTVNNNDQKYLYLSYSATMRDSLLNVSTMDLPDSCFADLMHLNYKGAKIFSQYLEKMIQSNQASSNNSKL